MLTKVSEPGVLARVHRVALLLALLGFVVSFVAAAKPLLGDGKNYGLVARSLASDGDIRLDEFAPRLSGNTRVEDGHVYNYFPLGPSLLMLPAYLAARAVIADATRAENVGARVTSALGYGASLALLFLVARGFETARVGEALGLALLFGFCSGQFPGHVGGLSSHGSCVTFVLGAMLALRRRTPWGAAGAALLFAGAYVMRPTAGVWFPLVAVWLWRYERELLRYFVIAAVVGAVAVALMNLKFYGHAQPPYNSLSRLRLAPLLVAAPGNLISPSRGLLLFFPWVIWAAVGGVRAFTDRSVDPWFRLMAAAVSVEFVVVGCFPQWWGGWCYGPRFLYEMFPAITLLLIPLLPELRAVHPSRIMFRRPVWLGAAAYSLIVALLGITPAAGRWNRDPSNVDSNPERVWDWSDPQILRPLRSRAATSVRALQRRPPLSSAA